MSEKTELSLLNDSSTERVSFNILLDYSAHFCLSFFPGQSFDNTLILFAVTFDSRFWSYSLFTWSNLSFSMATSYSYP